MTRQFLEPLLTEARDRMARIEVEFILDPSVNHKRRQELSRQYGKAWRQYEVVQTYYYYRIGQRRPQLRVPQEATA